MEFNLEMEKISCKLFSEATSLQQMVTNAGIYWMNYENELKSPDGRPLIDKVC